MALTTEKKQELIRQYGANPNDSGSVRAQVAILTQRIKTLNDHFTAHPKDHSSRRGLLKMVSKRRHLLDYLKQRDESAYRQLIEQVEIRK